MQTPQEYENHLIIMVITSLSNEIDKENIIMMVLADLCVHFHHMPFLHRFLVVQVEFEVFSEVDGFIVVHMDRYLLVT